MKKASAKFSLTFSIADKNYSAKGESIYDALKKITPEKFMGMGKILVETGGRKSHLPIKLVPNKLKRIFTNDWEMRIFAKRIQTLL